MIQPTFLGNDEIMLHRLMRLQAVGVIGGGRLAEETVTGNPVSFETDVAKPLKGLLIPFTPVQSGTGDPSPSNVRPITGFTGVNIARAGKNLAKMEHGYVPSISTGADTTTQGQRTDFIEINNASDYVASFGLSNDNYVLFYDTNKAYLGNFSVNKTTPKRLSTYANYSSAKYVKLRSDTLTEDPLAMLEIGTTATAYEPYTEPTIIPVSWETEAGTVYGGTLDALTGVLTVEYAIESGKWSEFTLRASDENYERRNRDYSQSFDASGGGKNAICNVGKKSWTDALTSSHFYVGGSLQVILPVGTSEDLEIVICCQLATPYTVQLDPVTLSTLKGTNTIWTDTNGENEIIYLSKKE